MSSILCAVRLGFHKVTGFLVASDVLEPNPCDFAARDVWSPTPTFTGESTLCFSHSSSPHPLSASRGLFLYNPLGLNPVDCSGDYLVMSNGRPSRYPVKQWKQWFKSVGWITKLTWICPAINRSRILVCIVTLFKSSLKADLLFYFLTFPTLFFSFFPPPPLLDQFCFLCLSWLCTPELRVPFLGICAKLGIVFFLCKSKWFQEQQKIYNWVTVLGKYYGKWW